MKEEFVWIEVCFKYMGEDDISSGYIMAVDANKTEEYISKIVKL